MHTNMHAKAAIKVDFLCMFLYVYLHIHYIYIYIYIYIDLVYSICTVIYVIRPLQGR